MKIYRYGNRSSENILLQPIDRRGIETIEQEAALIEEYSKTDFCLTAFVVDDWNRELSPWKAPAVFGKEEFGDGAEKTLAEILRFADDDQKRYFIGGYSLAGLFVLWAVYQTDRFAGAAAVSPSVWFPGLLDYMHEHETLADCIYLSLGDKEEKTKDHIIAQVGNNIREGHELLKSRNKICTLEWNHGSHFKEPELRTAKGFAWLLSQKGKTDI